MSRFAVGDRVRVVVPRVPMLHDRTGRVTAEYDRSLSVQLDGATSSLAFTASEVRRIPTIDADTSEATP